MPAPARKAPSPAGPGWLTPRERLTLAALGGLGLAGLGVSLWIDRPRPIQVVAGPEPQYAAWDAALDAAREIDVNRATAQELERLPHVGPSLAQRIVAWREAHGGFHTIDQLQDVPGIGPAIFEQVRSHVTVR